MPRNPDSISPVNGGVQKIYKFPNGYGASVVSSPFSYGGREGRWELAVLGPDDRLTYDTPVTSDVIGWLDEQEVEKHLDAIEALTPELIEAARVERENQRRIDRIAELRAELAALEAEVSA